MKKWFGFGGVWWTAPLTGDAGRLRPSPENPLWRLFGRRRAFLSRNSTSSLNTALLSGKFIFRLLPPIVWCRLVAIAGGISGYLYPTRNNHETSLMITQLFLIYFFFAYHWEDLVRNSLSAQRLQIQRPASFSFFGFFLFQLNPVGQT